MTPLTYVLDYASKFEFIKYEGLFVHSSCTYVFLFLRCLAVQAVGMGGTGHFGCTICQNIMYRIHMFT